MKEFTEPVIIPKIGKLWGRDAIFINKFELTNNYKLIIEGQFNSRLCSKPFRNDLISYKIEFKNIVHCQLYELDLYQIVDKYDYSASFEIVKNSKLLKLFIDNDHSDKISKAHKHYIFWGYDDVFEIISKGYIIKLEKMDK